MKSGMLRLTKSWMFWFLIFFQFIFIVVFSIKYVNNGTTNEERWYHLVFEYNEKELLIEDQIKSIEEQIKYIGQVSDKDSDSKELKKFYVESIEILMYLRDNNYNYYDIQEAEVIYYQEEDKRAYTMQIMEILLWVNMAVSIVLLGLIVNSGKTNGAFIFEILLKGRKKLFFKEAKLYFTIMTFFLLYQIALVAGLNMQFPQKSKYILHYNGGDIKVLPQWLEFVWAILALILSMVTVFMLHFIISQLISNVFTFSIIAISATIGEKWLLANISMNKFTIALNISMNNIYENGISLGYYLLVMFVKCLLIFSFVYMTYLYCMKRKLNIRAN